jgi:hypothetical protein
MSSLLQFARPIDERGVSLDEHMVATKVEGPRPQRYSRGGALNLAVKMAPPGEAAIAIASLSLAAMSA